MKYLIPDLIVALIFNAFYSTNYVIKTIIGIILINRQLEIYLMLL